MTMVASNRSRYLAPLALAAAAGATVVVVTSSTGGSSHHAATAAPSVAATTGSRPQRRRRIAPRLYVVKSGDTLSRISVKTGIPVATIESLNPGVDPAALQTGQRLKLAQ